MPRDSIFDPEGTQTEHSGTRYMGPSADQDSHMPPGATDGKVEDEDDQELQSDDLDNLAEANKELEAERESEQKTNPDSD